MRRSRRRWLAGVMTTVMLVCLMPTAVYAAVGELVRNSAVENAALLAALKDAYGEDAETYYALLRAYGLLDENGELVTDLTQVATVDGTPITLKELALVLEIERYLAYVQATYFTPQDLTDEQVASFYDLADAWANGQVAFYGLQSV